MSGHGVPQIGTERQRTCTRDKPFLSCLNSWKRRLIFLSLLLVIIVLNSEQPFLFPGVQVWVCRTASGAIQDTHPVGFRNPAMWFLFAGPFPRDSLSPGAAVAQERGDLVP